MTRLAAPSTRARRAVESFRCAAECIGSISPGMSLFALTRGQFSMIDAILHVLNQAGPAAVSVWTWGLAEFDLQCLERLSIDGRLTSALLVIDPAARARNAERLRAWVERHGPSSVRIVRTHAEMATVASASGLRVLLRGSLNLNFNPRLEQFDITEGGADFDLVRQAEEELPVLPLDCGGREPYEAAKLSQAFPPETLELFTGGRAWRP